MAALAVFALASCKPAAKGAADASGFVMSPAVAELDKSLDGLRKSDFKVSGGAQADVNAVIAALPKSLSVKFAGQSFDAGSGATVLSKVTVSSTDLPDVALNIDEVKLWGLDTAFATARLSGQRLADSGALARRVEAKNLTVVGLDKTMEKFMKGFISGLPTGTDASGIKINKYDVSIAHVVYDNVKLRPYELKPAVLAEDSPAKELMPFVQGVAALANSFAMDASLVDGVKGDTDILQGEIKQAQKFEIATIASRGVNGGDTAAMLMRGTKQDMAMTGAGPNGKPYTLAFAGGTDISTVENFRFAKLLHYLAIATLPPRTETDLMSGGLWRSGPTHYTLNGKPLMDSKDATFDATGFHWLIPTKLTFEAKDLVIHIDNAMETFETAMSSDGQPGAMKAQKDVLTKYGLGAPTLNLSGGWNWDPKGGAAKLDAHVKVGGWDQVDFKLDGGFPTFDQVSAQIPDTGDMSEAQEDALMKLFTSDTMLRAFNFDLVDEGGSGKVFGLIADMMAADPSVPKGSAPTAQTMKDESINQLNTSASQMKDASPAMAAVMSAFAEFLSKGTAVHLAANPNPPVTAADFEKLMNADKAASDRLNVTVNGKKP
jgi:hypothetical protein